MKGQQHPSPLVEVFALWLAVVSSGTAQDPVAESKSSLSGACNQLSTELALSERYQEKLKLESRSSRALSSLFHLRLHFKSRLQVYSYLQFPSPTFKLRM